MNKDHSRSAKYLVEHAVNVHATKDTLCNLGILEERRAIALTPLKKCKIGAEFEVIAFPLQHDVTNYGFLLRNTLTCKALLFLTDTYYCEYVFDNVDAVLVEANYSMDIVNKRVEDGLYKHEYSLRLRESHFEINNTITFLQSMDLSRTKKIMLIHLSKENANPELFKRMVEEATGIETIIAEKGVAVNV